MRILHVQNIANVGQTLVSGLNEICETAELYEPIKYKKNIHPRILRKLIGLLIAVIELIRFSFYIRLNHFNIIHIHYGTMAYLALLNRIPFFLHIHGTDVREEIHDPIEGYFIKRGLENAEEVFFSTPDLEKIIKPFQSKAIFFPNPVDLEEFKPKPQAPNLDSIDVFSISKLDKYKGVNAIIDTISLLINHQKNITIMMFGFGNAINEISESFEKLRNSSMINIIGYIPHGEMMNYINKSKIILGQLGTGILTCSELEAMACAKPVVCNFSYGSMYQSEPPVVFAEDSEAAEKQIIELLNCPQKAIDIGNKARRWMEENFDKRLIARKLLGYYQKM